MTLIPLLSIGVMYVMCGFGVCYAHSKVNTDPTFPAKPNGPTEIEKKNPFKEPNNIYPNWRDHLAKWMPKPVQVDIDVNDNSPNGTSSTCSPKSFAKAHSLTLSDMEHGRRYHSLLPDAHNNIPDTNSSITSAFLEGLHDIDLGDEHETRPLKPENIDPAPSKSISTFPSLMRRLRGTGGENTGGEENEVKSELYPLIENQEVSKMESSIEDELKDLLGINCINLEGDSNIRSPMMSL